MALVEELFDGGHTISDHDRKLPDGILARESHRDHTAGATTDAWDPRKTGPDTLWQVGETHPHSQHTHTNTHTYPCNPPIHFVRPWSRRLSTRTHHSTQTGNANALPGYIGQVQVVGPVLVPAAVARDHRAGRLPERASALSFKTCAPLFY
eukprot:1153258-Rhodomonas_salina.1